MTDIINRLGILATDHESDDIIPDVALDAADEIEALRQVVCTLGVYAFTDDTLGPFIAAEKDIGLSVDRDVADAVERARGNGTRKRQPSPTENGSKEQDR